MATRYPLLGEALFVLCALLVIITHHFNLSIIAYWNMVPVLIFGASWVICKKRSKVVRYSSAIGSTIGMLMLLYSNLVMWFDMRETGASLQEASLMYTYIPIYSLLAGGLAWLAIFIVLSIKRKRGEF
ncbi:hypothetical protein CWE09_01495 [Aliidiomarina minuta]|uniref:Transmembrane protein n=1 Tax=Aliidiomarina minuta TaxID=880057 RepID=A0A432W5T8_9GAMM|nr:hypothetical protein [Aliidiomarina minuta]RUO25438.1 hypothetical protein CWE09_01495 [Aliidiomarina minuta]